MRLTKYLLPMLIAAGSIVSTPVSAQGFFGGRERGGAGQESRSEKHLRERDDILVRDFVESKENVELEEKDTHLDISGDVRFEWRNLHERGDVIFVEDDRFVEKYENLRGGGAIDTRGLPVSNNDWDVEFNIKFKYTLDKAWAYAHLQFDNSAGIRGFNECIGPYRLVVLDDSTESLSSDSDDIIVLSRDSRYTLKGSGDSNGINLKRAYMGYNVWADGVHRFDIEIGRRKLDDIFVSEIEFSSRFDGILLKYATSFDPIGEFYWNIGAFIIDERVNQIGYATEFGLINIYDTGLDLRYSFIDWRKRGENRCFIRDPIGCDFAVSQISFSYNFETDICCKKIPTEVYGGFLVNHAARKTDFTKHKRANLGWYAGLYLGEVEKKGDWAIDIEYFYVGAQAVSDTDVGGVGRGNIQDERLTDMIFDPKGIVKGDDEISDSSSALPSSTTDRTLSSSELSVFLPRRGNANYTGGKIEVLYAITDNLSIDTEYEFSYAADRHIGGRHFYSNFEIEMIFAF